MLGTVSQFKRLSGKGVMGSAMDYRHSEIMHVRHDRGVGAGGFLTAACGVCEKGVED